MSALKSLLIVAVVGSADAAWASQATAAFVREIRSFGESVAVFDDTIVVGAPESQKALIFARNPDGTWGDKAAAVLKATSDHKDNEEEEKSDFGWDVAIDGSLVAVGSPKKQRVYVFRRSGSGPSSTWTLDGNVHMAAESFGHTVALTGKDGLVVGAPDHGYVYIYERSESWRNPVATVHGENGYGHAIGACNNRVIVGSPNARRIYIYEKEGGPTSWPDIPNAIVDHPNLGFGFAVKVAGDYAIIGAPYSQKAYIYERQDAANWGDEPFAEFDYPEESGFGHAVDIVESGHAIVTSHTARKAHIFAREGGVWVGEQVIDAYVNSDGAFGMAMAMNENRFVVSAYPTRRVYVFDYQEPEDPKIARQNKINKRKLANQKGLAHTLFDDSSNMPFLVLVSLGGVLLLVRRKEVWAWYVRRLAKQRKKGEAA